MANNSKSDQDQKFIRSLFLKTKAIPLDASAGFNQKVISQFEFLDEKESLFPSLSWVAALRWLWVPALAAAGLYVGYQWWVHRASNDVHQNKPEQKNEPSGSGDKKNKNLNGVRQESKLPPSMKIDLNEGFLNGVEVSLLESPKPISTKVKRDGVFLAPNGLTAIEVRKQTRMILFTYRPYNSGARPEHLILQKWAVNKYESLFELDQLSGEYFYTIESAEFDFTHPHQFRLAALGQGVVLFSDPALIKLSPDTPSTPIQLELKQDLDGTKLIWIDPNPQKGTSFIIEFKKSDQDSFQLMSTHLGYPTTEKVSLLGSQNIWFRIKAVNQSKESPYSQTLFLKGNSTSENVLIPAPDHLVGSWVVKNSMASMAFTWNAPHSPLIRGFYLESTSDKSNAFKRVAKINVSQNSYVLEGPFTPGKSYQIRIAAFGDSGISDYSNTVALTQALLPQPQLLSAGIKTVQDQMEYLVKFTVPNPGPDDRVVINADLNHAGWRRLGSVSARAGEFHYPLLRGNIQGVCYEGATLGGCGTMRFEIQSVSADGKISHRIGKGICPVDFDGDKEYFTTKDQQAWSQKCQGHYQAPECSVAIFDLNGDGVVDDNDNNSTQHSMRTDLQGLQSQQVFKCAPENFIDAPN